METASWVIREKGTGRVICETFNMKVVDALNVEKYEAVPILEYLQGLNRKIAPTPMTDAAKWDADLGNWVVDIEFARGLERDRARLVRALQDIQGLIAAYPKHFNAGEVSMEQYMENANALLRELGEE